MHAQTHTFLVTDHPQYVSRPTKMLDHPHEALAPFFAQVKLLFR